MSKTYSAGIVTAYGAAKRAGYQGTYEDFCRQQAGYAESAATVEQAKNTAVSAASTATTKAGEAATAATAAQTAKTQTEQSASQALTDIATARSGAISAVRTEGATQTANATAQAQAAAQSATTASTKASEASASATTATTKATEAATSATSAAQSASDAQDVLDSIPADYSDLSANVSQLQADLKNATDILHYIDQTFGIKNYLAGLGVDSTPAAGTIKRIYDVYRINLNGTQSAINLQPYNSSTALPTWWAAGATKNVGLFSTVAGATLQIYAYVSGSPTLVKELEVNTSSNVTMPSNATGAIVRLRVAASTVIDGDFLPYITDQLTNAQLQALISSTESAFNAKIESAQEDDVIFSELADTYEVDLTFAASADGKYINTSGEYRDATNAKYSNPVYFPAGTIIKFKVQGQANVFGVITKTTSDGTPTNVLVISDTSTYKWYSYTVVSSGYYVFCGYYNRYDWRVYANANKQEKIDRLLYNGTTIYDNQISYSGVSFIVDDNNVLYFDITKIYDTVINVYDLDNDIYLPIKSVDSGTVMPRSVATVGTYVVDTSNTKKVRFDNYQSSANAPVSLVAYTSVRNPYGLDSLMRNAGTAPRNQSATQLNLVQGSIPQGFVSGAIYGTRTDAYVVNKSVDNGSNWTALKTFDQAVYRIVALDNGYFLVLLNDGTLMRTNDWTNITEIMTFTKKPHTLFGINVYKNHVLMSEYGAYNTSKKVYYSSDYGATFSEIFDLETYRPEATGHHLHTAVFDPYENLIWVCSGDGMNNQMYFVSADYGTNWTLCGEFGNMPTQATYIMPLRDCVLFASDARLVDVIRYNRPLNGTTMTQTFKFELAQTFAQSWGKTDSTEVPIASTAFVDYEKSIAYFGYAIISTAASGSTATELTKGLIIATNGHKFSRVHIDADTVAGGIQGIWGDPEAQKIVVRYVNVRENALVLDVSDIVI